MQQNDTPKASINVLPKYVCNRPSKISDQPSPTVSKIDRNILPSGISNTNEKMIERINQSLEDDFHFI